MAQIPMNHIAFDFHLLPFDLDRVTNILFWQRMFSGSRKRLLQKSQCEVPSEKKR